MELDTRDSRRASVGYENLYLLRKVRLTLDVVESSGNLMRLMSFKLTAFPDRELTFLPAQTAIPKEGPI